MVPDTLNKKIPASCTVRVYRKDRSRPTTATCYYSEYARTTASGKDRWSTAPFDMLEKCALAKALRRTFIGLSGTYEEAELTQDPSGNIIPIAQAPSKDDQIQQLLNESAKGNKSYFYNISTIDPEKRDAAIAHIKKNKGVLVDTGDGSFSTWESSEYLPRLANFLVKE